MDIRPVLIVITLAVVDIELAFCVRGLRIERDDESVGVIAHQAATATGAVFTGEDIPGAHEDGDAFQGSGESDGFACAFVRGVGEIIVEDFIGREIDRYGVCAFRDNGLHEQAGTAEVELVFDGEGGFVRGVDVVVRLEDWSAGYGCFMEGGVPGWEERVA